MNRRIRFGILGPLRAACDGRDLDLGGPKPRRLLLALLVERGRPVADDRLVELLWGADRPARVAVSLQAYVSNLRAALRPDPEVALLRRSGGYLLQVPPGAVDVDTFEVDLATARTALAAGDAAGARTLLDEALATWRGPALPELEDDPLVRAEATRLDELHTHALEHRAEAALAMGDPVAAVAELQALVSRNPLRERLCELLMLALYRTGRQADALEQARALRDRLAEDLGVDPSPALSAMETAILRQDPALEAAPGRAEQARAIAGPVAPPADPVPSPTAELAAPIAPAEPGPAQPAGRVEGPPLVGRDDALDRLDQAWADATAGRGSLVLIHGEAGIGKSRLAEALAEHAAASGGRVGWGRCFETAGAPVLWPWVQVLRAGLATGLAPLPDDVALLGGLLPELGSTEPPPTGQDARFRMLQAITRTVVGATATAPAAADPTGTDPATLVIVEDLHWADQSSLDVLEHLAPLLSTARCMVVATHRDSTADLGPCLPGTLARLARLTTVHHVPLGPLDRPALRRLAAAAEVPEEVLDDVAGVLVERSDGNPLFAGQLLAVLQRGGDLPDGVPQGLRALLAERVARLPDPTREALRAGAIIGREFAPALVATATGTDLSAVLGSLDPAAELGLVAPLPGSDRYRFVHVLLRDTLYDTTPPGARIRLHAAVGLSLEADRSRVAEAAHHLRHAAVLGLADRAADAAVLAAERAERVQCWAEAEQHLRDALSLVTDDPDRERRILTRLASMQLMTLGYSSPDLRESATRLGQLATGRGEVELATWALWVGSCTLAEHEEALAIAEEAVAAADPDGPAARLASAHQMHGTSLWHLGRVTDAHDAFEQAIAAIGRLDERERRSAVMSHVVQTCFAHSAANLWALGGHEEARRRTRRALDLAQPIGPFALAFARQSQAYVGTLLGDPSLTAQARWAMGIMTTHGYRQLAPMAKVIAAWYEAVAEQDPAGLVMGQQALEELEEVGVRMMLPAFGRTVAAMLAHYDRLEDADIACARALEVAERTGEHMVSADLLRRRAVLALRMGADGTALMDRARALAQAQGAAHLAARCDVVDVTEVGVTEVGQAEAGAAEAGGPEPTAEPTVSGVG